MNEGDEVDRVGTGKVPHTSAVVQGDAFHTPSPASSGMMKRLQSKLNQIYDEHPMLGAIVAGSALVLAVSVVHAMVSYSSALRPVYVFPIWLATRMGGRVSGLIVVVLSTLAGTMADWQLGHTPNETLASNFFFRFLGLVPLMLLIAHVEGRLQKHQRLALTDPLTGLLNRHALKEFAGQAFDRALLREQPVTAVVIDCDGFKQLNDTYGHKAGDHVLMLLARSLEKFTRQTDLVARLGGDEFAVVFQNTDLDEARKIMERVDDAFVQAVTDAGYAAGLSIGYGSRSEQHNELEAVLEVADAAMYQHKQAKKSAAFLK